MVLSGLQCCLLPPGWGLCILPQLCTWGICMFSPCHVAVLHVLWFPSTVERHALRLTDISVLPVVYSYVCE